MSSETIKVDVVSDVACPWCYVGKKRLEKALAQWKGAPVEVEWHPYQLDPTIPEEGLDRITYLTNKFGDMESVQPMTDRLVEAGEDEGITFNFGDKWLAVNTLPLHQLLHVAGEEGFKAELKERFLKAYFDKNLHLNKIEVLTGIMADYGWSEEKTEAVIANENIAYAVKQEIVHYQQLGVRGVPFFIIYNKYAISGAQPSDVFLQALSKVAPLEIINEGDTCDPLTGNC